MTTENFTADKRKYRKLLRGGSGLLAAAVLIGSFPTTAYGASAGVSEMASRDRDGRASGEGAGTSGDSKTGNDSKKEAAPAKESGSEKTEGAGHGSQDKGEGQGGSHEEAGGGSQETGSGEAASSQGKDEEAGDSGSAQGEGNVESSSGHSQSGDTEEDSDSHSQSGDTEESSENQSQGGSAGEGSDSPSQDGDIGAGSESPSQDENPEPGAENRPQEDDTEEKPADGSQEDDTEGKPDGGSQEDGADIAPESPGTETGQTAPQEKPGEAGTEPDHAEDPVKPEVQEPSLENGKPEAPEPPAFKPQLQEASPADAKPAVMALSEELAEGDVAVNEENFPDGNFRGWILKQPMGRDKVLSRKELEETTYINISRMEIEDLTGIQYFENLTGLICEYNSLDQADLSGNSKLEVLDISNNHLERIDVSFMENLKDLDVFDNELTELDLGSNTNLVFVSAGWNNLTELDLSSNDNLEDISLNDNDLKTIHLPDNGMLVDLKKIEEQRVPDEGYRLKVKWLDGSQSPIEENFRAEGQTITSKLDPIQYRVSYYEDERSYTPWKEEQYSYGDGVEISQAPNSRDGYEFSGWKVRAGKTYEAGQALAGPLTLKDGRTVALYGQWTGNPYTIVFHSNPPSGSQGADEVIRQDMVYGKAAALKANSFEAAGTEDYQFVGWSLESGDGQEVAYYNRMQVSDLTSEKNGEVHLYAQWRVAPKYYDVTFKEMEEGVHKSTATQQVLEEAKAREASVGFKKGYRFDGWYTSEALSEDTKYDFDMAVTQPVTLYGNWYTEHYRVEFISDGQVIHSEDVQMDNSLTLPAAPERSGYRFAGWYETEDCQGYAYDSGRTVGQDMKLYAKWVQASQYKVQFESNQGSPVESQMVEEGGRVSVPQEPERPGYRFTGWYADPVLTVPFDFNEAIRFDRVIYAGWEKLAAEKPETERPEAGGADENGSQDGAGGHETPGKPETPEENGGGQQPSENGSQAGESQSGSSASRPSGGSGGSGGGGGGGGSAKPSGPKAETPGAKEPAPAVYAEPVQGSWRQTEQGWRFDAADSRPMENAWAVIGDAWYLFDGQGYMRTGWYEDPQGQWYYLGSQGAMATGWQQIGGGWYYFQADGSMAKETEIDGFQLDASGLRISR